MLTNLQRGLVQCFKAYGMDQDETVGSMLMLRTEKMQEEMFDWIKQNTSASTQEVINQVGRIQERFFIRGIIENVISGEKEFYNPVFFCGTIADVAAVCAKIEKSFPIHNGKKIIRTSVDQCYNSFIIALSNRTLDEFRSSFHNCDLLILENIDFLSKTQTFQEELYFILDKLSASGCQFVYGGYFPPDKLPNLDDHLLSFLKSGIYSRVDSSNISGFEDYLPN